MFIPFFSSTWFFRVKEHFMLAISLLHHHFALPSVQRKSYRAVCSFYSADNQRAALCESVMFKYRIQHLLKKAASTCLWIAFPLLKTNADFTFLAFVRRPHSQLQLLWGASKAWMYSDSAKTAYTHFKSSFRPFHWSFRVLWFSSDNIWCEESFWGYFNLVPTCHRYVFWCVYVLSFFLPWCPAFIRGVD